MNKYISMLALTLATAAAANAQQNLYINSVSENQKPIIDMIPNAERVAFTSGGLVVTRNGQEAIYPITPDSRTTFKQDITELLKKVPQPVVDQLEFEVAFDNADRALAANAETPVTDEKDAAYNDFVEHSQWTSQITVTYDGDKANVGGAAEGVEITTDGANVIVRSSAIGVEYILKGKSDNGSFRLYSDKKVKLTLDGLSLYNPVGPAINSQCRKSVYVVLPKGADNYLSDGTSYAEKINDEDQKGCFFSEGQLLFSGEGALTVNGNKKNGIVSDDYIRFSGGFVKSVVTVKKGAALQAKDEIIFAGGAQHLASHGNASKTVVCDSVINVKGGKLVVINTGGVIMKSDSSDYSSSSCIKAEMGMTINGGEIRVHATGTGGKGLNIGYEEEYLDPKTEKMKVKYGGPLVINDGKIYVKTTGQRIPEIKESNDFTGPASSPKGMKVCGDLTINDGEIHVHCIGGVAAEGIESKSKLTINKGTIFSTCMDDIFNASSTIVINGGNIIGISTGDDGIDSASGFKITGGNIYVCSGDEQAALDCDGKNFYFQGGTLVGVGNTRSSKPNKKPCTSVHTIFLDQGNYGQLREKGGDVVTTFPLPPTYPINKKNTKVPPYRYGVLVASDKMQVGKEYEMCVGQKLLGGDWNGALIENAQFADGDLKVVFTFTAEEGCVALGEEK
ncbi:MAG: carbohydrate-binding domain-containing protein [Bacteroidaceae bacterium]|nr:carbohydrate-binding domain-containing protein [Bacteroidaceae bacterium]